MKFYNIVLLLTILSIGVINAREVKFYTNGTECNGEAIVKQVDTCVTDYPLGDWKSWSFTTFANGKYTIRGFKGECTSGNQAIGSTEQCEWNQCCAIKQIQGYMTADSSRISIIISIIFSILYITLF